MKLPCLLCLLLAVWAVAARAADPPPTITNAATNSPAASGTNDLPEPVAPGREFTNSVDMLLVQVPDGFWAGKFEVTQKEYQKVMGANPSEFGGDTQPVDNVSYPDALEFCKKLTALDLTKKKLPEGFRYTLPTEGEWTNLLADAGLDNAITSLNGNLRTSSSPVGSLGANRLGLFDMRGNVMEFILADESKPYRILKGGSWADRVDVNLRPEFRWYCKPEDHLNTFGFRCVLKEK